MDKVAIYSARPYEQPTLIQACQGRWEQLFLSASLSEQTVSSSLQAKVVSLFVEDAADRSILEQLARQGVRMISLRCSGYDRVDLRAAAELAMIVTHVPGYSPHAVAEFALMLALALLRKLPQSQQRVRQQDFSLSGLEGLELQGRVVGVVGFGHIGQVFARLVAACGAQVLICDPLLENAPQLGSEAKPAALPGQSVSLLELLARSEIVSLHCPLLPDTEHLINHKTLGLMRRGAFLINTARGRCVDTQAVEQALRSGQLGGFAMDVYEREQGLFFHDHSQDGCPDQKLQSLLELPNVIVTGHQAFLTKEALTQIADTEAANISAFLAGQPPPHPIT